jgi:hypothetical protein
MDEHNHVPKRRRLTSFLGPNDENIADPEDEFQQVNIYYVVIFVIFKVSYQTFETMIFRVLF